MNPTDRPEAYGVFKPVGHVIVAFPTESDAQAALTALMQEGFDASDIVAYSPAQMKRQADIDIEQAGVLAGIGQELNLVKAHREMAEKGHSFLVVHAPKDAQAQQVADTARRFNATRAQSYGHLVIEELIEVGSGDHQVAESPDRGLDAQTRSGEEASAVRR
jgi:methionyl-tRNA formyltransferase